MAEDRAAIWLASQGLIILHVRYQVKHHDIDIVAQDGDVLCFIEVRFRHRHIQDAVQSITGQKQKAMWQAALLYVVQQQTVLPCRFDMIAMNARGEMLWLKHVMS